jgi:hypothetical protein
MADRRLDHMTMIFRVLIIALSILAAVASMTCADSSLSTKNEIFGNWAGSGSINQKTVHVELEVNTEGADLNFGSPLKCDAFAEYIESNDGKHTYRFRAKAGGSLQGECKKLRDKDMVLGKNDNGTLSLSIPEDDETLILEIEK